MSDIRTPETLTPPSVFELMDTLQALFDKTTRLKIETNFHTAGSALIAARLVYPDRKTPHDTDMYVVPESARTNSHDPRLEDPLYKVAVLNHLLRKALKLPAFNIDSSLTNAQ